MNKRAALELSINAIVIVVIAMTVLGLGLGFVRSQIGKMKSTTTVVQEEIKAQILEDLRSGDKKLSIQSIGEIVSSGEKRQFAIGIKNLKDQPITFSIGISKAGKNAAGATEFTAKLPDTKNSGDFFWDNTQQTLGIGESQVYPITYKAETSADTYLYKIELAQLSPPCTGTPAPTKCVYDSKSFFITVG